MWSFYWNIFNAEIPKHIFANEAFWYYNNKVYPDFYSKPVFTSNLNLKKEVESMDVIMVMVTERFLNIFDWELIDQLYYLYTPDFIKNPIYDYKNSILKDANWFDKIIREAIANNEIVGKALHANAVNQYYIDNKSDYMMRFGPKSYINYVSNHNGLVKKLELKASKENKTFDEVLYEEANYLFKIQNPKLFDIYNRIVEKEKYIRRSDQLFDSIEELSRKYYCNINDMIFYQAKKMIEEENVQLEMREAHNN